MRGDGDAVPLPSLGGTTVANFHYDLYHVMPGRELEAEAIAKEFLTLFKSKNIPNGYWLFKAEMGPEMPTIIIEVGAKDPADS